MATRRAPAPLHRSGRAGHCRATHSTAAASPIPTGQTTHGCTHPARNNRQGSSRYSRQAVETARETIVRIDNQKNRPLSGLGKGGGINQRAYQF